MYAIRKMKAIMTVLNADKNGCAVTLTTAHHYSGNITHPRQGFREMGVLIEFFDDEQSKAF